MAPMALSSNDEAPGVAAEPMMKQSSGAHRMFVPGMDAKPSLNLPPSECVLLLHPTPRDVRRFVFMKPYLLTLL